MTRGFELRGLELVTRGLELMTRGFELVTRGFELEHLVSTRGSKLLIRISQLVTRNSCDIKQVSRKTICHIIAIKKNMLP